VMRAKETLDFCPPERRYIGLRAKLPEIPNEPRWDLITSPVSSGLDFISYSTGERRESSMSI